MKTKNEEPAAAIGTDGAHDEAITTEAVTLPDGKRLYHIEAELDADETKALDAARLAGEDRGATLKRVLLSKAEEALNGKNAPALAQNRAETRRGGSAVKETQNGKKVRRTQNKAVSVESLPECYAKTCGTGQNKNFPVSVKFGVDERIKLGILAKAARMTPEDYLLDLLLSAFLQRTYAMTPEQVECEVTAWGMIEVDHDGVLIQAPAIMA